MSADTRDWTAEGDNHRSSDGWLLEWRATSTREHIGWDVRDPSGDIRAYGCKSVTAAQDVADKLRMIVASLGLDSRRGRMTGCMFCEAGPEDDCTDECMTRGLSAQDALLLARSRESRIATLMAEAKALREYAAMRAV